MRRLVKDNRPCAIVFYVCVFSYLKYADALHCVSSKDLFWSYANAWPRFCLFLIFLFYLLPYPPIPFVVPDDLPLSNFIGILVLSSFEIPIKYLGITPLFICLLLETTPLIQYVLQPTVLFQ